MERFPGGFAHPEMVERGRPHKIPALTAKAREAFAPERFENAELMAEAIVKAVTASSMVSVFEKPKFRDFVRSLSALQRARLCAHMRALVHGDMRQGFEGLVEFLAPAKLAKWTLVTVVPYYVRPTEEAFVKPTTAKAIIAHYALEGLSYAARPEWAFYSGYRAALKEMMGLVHPSLGPDMAAFSAFLMIGAGAW